MQQTETREASSRLGGAIHALPRTLVRALDRSPVALGLLTVEVVLLTLAWSALDWSRYQLLHLFVFDFGLTYRDIWTASQQLLINGHPGVYLFVPVFWLLPNQQTFFLFLLVFQNAFLMVGAYFVYLIARNALGSVRVGWCLGSAYAAFPALSGILWFPFHVEGLFPTLFLAGYWLYRTQRYAPTAAIWALALVTNVGAPVIIAAFAAGILLDPALARLRRQRGARPPTGIARGKLALAGLLLAAPIVVIGAVMVYQGVGPTFDYLFSTTPLGQTGSGSFFEFGPVANLGGKVGAVLLIFGPFLFLPLWAREERWALLPYWIPALLSSNHPGFVVPFVVQYPAFTVPVVFAAAIRGIERWRSPVSPVIPARDSAASPIARRPAAGWSRRTGRGVFRSPTRVSAVVLAVVTVLFVISSPVGPLNRYTRSTYSLAWMYYNVPGATRGNLTIDTNIRAMAGLAPYDGPILVQDNLPELLNRNGVVVPGCYVAGAPLRYLVNDPFDPRFYAPALFPGCNGTGTMYTWSNYFLTQGWGVLAEVDGALLLASNFSGPPKLYIPLSLSFPSSVLAPGTPAAGIPWNGSAGATLWSGIPRPLWATASLALVPGEFALQIVISLDHPQASNYLDVAIVAGSSTVVAARLGADNWTATSGTVSATVPFLVPEYYLAPTVTIRVGSWSGPLALQQIGLLQSGPVP